MPCDRNVVKNGVISSPKELYPTSSAKKNIMFGIVLKSAAAVLAKLNVFVICDISNVFMTFDPLYDTATNPNDITTTKLPAKITPARRLLDRDDDEDDDAELFDCSGFREDEDGADTVLPPMTEP